jgi:hypothetical protein
VRKTIIGVAAIALVHCGYSTGWAVVANIGASKDSTIFQNSVNNSSGAGNGLFAGTNGNSSPRRALIAFDVAGSIPAFSTIQSVQLNLVLGQVPNGASGNATIDLHKLSADWGEGIAQQSTPPTDSLGGQGNGVAANAGDVTWNAKMFPGTLWATPGGDFSAGVSGSATVGTTINATSSWLSTAALVSDVQGWVNNPSSNFGWILTNANEAGASTFRAFYSSEVATAALHPQLVVNYTPSPEGFRKPASVVSQSSDGAWRYSVSANPHPPGGSTTYFPTAASEFAAAAFSSYVLPDATVSTITGGDSWAGTGVAQKFHVFDTYVLSDHDQTIPLGIRGDDGHSLFVDGAFVGGGGSGQAVNFNLALQAGVKRRLTLAGYNGAGDFSFSVGTPIAPPPGGNPVFTNGLAAVAGVKLNADGNFPGIPGTTQLGNLNDSFADSQQLGGGVAAASSFVTGPSSYRLDGVTLGVHTFGGGTGEVRIRADNANSPGSLVGSLGIKPATNGGGGTVTAFSSTGILLQPNTRYWLTAGERAEGDFQWFLTVSDQLDAPSSWSIGDVTSLSTNMGDSWNTQSRFGQPHERFMFSVDAPALGQFLPADFDENTNVNGADLARWRTGFGKAIDAVHLDGDANGDGAVDGGDFLTWQSQLGSHLPIVPVPEPAVATLALLTFVMLGGRIATLRTISRYR